MAEKNILQNKQKMNLVYLVHLMQYQPNGQKIALQYTKCQQTVSQIIQQTKLSLVIKPKAIEGIESKIIGKSLKYQYFLRKINLTISSKCHFNDEGIMSIAKSFQNLTNISSLTLIVFDQNNIGIKGASFLGQSLKLLTNLQNLQIEIYSNSIKYEGSNNIVLGMKELSNLKQAKLHLINVDITSIDILHILKNISMIRLEEVEYKFKVNEQMNELELQEYSEQIQKLKNLPNLSNLNLIIDKRLFVQSNAQIIEEIIQLKSFSKLDFKLIQQLNQFMLNNQNKIYFNYFEKVKSLLLSLETPSCLTELANQNEFLNEFKNLKKLKIAVSPQIVINQKYASNIGQALKQLSRIQKLTIQFHNSNQLEENHVYQIFQGLQGCQNLQMISFQVDLPTAFLFVGVINYLKELNLEQIEIRDLIIPFIRNPVTKEIQEINLENCFRYTPIGNQGCQYLVSSFKSLNTLKDLSLSINQFNNISYIGYETIGNGFTYLTSLNNLKLRISDMYGFNNYCFSKLIKEIGQLQKMKSFSLDLNSYILTIDSTIQLFDVLGKLKYLESLHIGFDVNMLSSIYSYQLVDKLKLVNYLTSLSIIIGDNRIGIEGLNMLGDWFQQLSLLKKFKISLPNLPHPQKMQEEDLLCQLTKKINILKHVECLSINFRNISNCFFQNFESHSFIQLIELNISIIIVAKQDTLFNNLANCIQQLKHLGKLEFNLCQYIKIQENQLQQLKEGIKKLKFLKYLSLIIYSNLQFVDNFDKFSHLFINLDSIQILKLSFNGNKLQGNPISIFKRKVKRLVICN